MTKNFFLLLCFIVSTASLNTDLHAQRGSAIPPISDELKTTLNLSDGQVEALEMLHQETQQKITDQQTERRQLRQNTQEQLANILTPEQLEQLNQHRAEMRESRKAAMENVDRDAMRAELKAYKQENIKPIKQAFRQQFDEHMTEEDRNALAEVRNTLREARKAHRAEREANKSEKQEAGDHRGQRDEMRTRHRKSHARRQRGERSNRLQEQHPEEWAILENLANKYGAQLTDIFTEIKPLHEQWRADMGAIKAKYLPERPQHDRPDRNEIDEEKAESRDQMRKVRFLLMNPEGKEQPQEVSSINATAFPNPASETTTLTFDLPEADKVQILLNDENGKIVQEVADQFFEAGKHELTVALRGLQNGVFYISLSGDKTHEAVRVVVNN